MNMINQIALANAKYHKSKNILSGIAIFLTTLLLFLVPTIGLDLLTTQKATINELYPSWHALYRNISVETATKLSSHHLVEQYGLRCDLGKISSISCKNSLMYMDESAFDLYKISILEGRLPEAENEIVVSKEMLKEISSDPAIGDTISLSYQVSRQDGLDYAKEKDFVITGFVKDSGSDDEDRGYSAFISHALIHEELSKDEISYRFLFKIDEKSARDTDEFEYNIKQLASQFGISENNIKINSDVLWANYIDPSFVPVLVIIMLVIVLAGIITIYSIYYISIGERIQELGKLKAIGATTGQLKRVVLMEGLLAAAVAIPAGLLVGTVLTKTILSLMFNIYSADNIMMETTKMLVAEGKVSVLIPWVYLLTIAVSLLTVILSLMHPMKKAAGISEIEAMRYHDATVTKKKRKGYLNLSIVKLTNIQLSGNKKRSIITICSMAVTGLFFMVVATVLSCTNPKEAANNSIWGEYRISPNVEFGNKEHPELEWSEIQKNNPLTDELREKILNIDGITSVEYIKASYVTSDVFDGDRSGIIGIPESLKDILEKGIIEGNVSYEDLSSGDKVIVDNNILYWYPDIKLGDIIDVTFNNGDEIVSKKLEIVAIGDYELSFTNYNYLILSEEGIESFSNYNCNKYMNIYASKKYDANVKSQLKAILSEYGNMELATWQSYYEDWESGIVLTKVGCYALLGVLGAICIMNMINTMISSVHARKKEFGMLQAIGMSDSQLLRMLQLESSFYTLGTVIIAVIGGSILGYPIFLWAKDNSVFNIRNYHYPFGATLIMIVILTVIQILITLVISKSIRKDSLIDRIRFSN